MANNLYNAIRIAHRSPTAILNLLVESYTADYQFIRQQWRMWIETLAMRLCTICSSPKFIRQQWRMWIETAFSASVCPSSNQFIRQQWRMWIETVDGKYANQPSEKFIRQQWRMWIETEMVTIIYNKTIAIHSPAMANVD